MDIEKLKTKIRAGLVDEQFALKTLLLESAFINRVSNDCFPDNTLKLSAASIEESADGASIIVRGTGVDYPFREMQTELVFYLEDVEAALKLTAKGNAVWTLDTGLPPFAESLAAALRFAATPEPTFFLYSHSEPGGAQAINFTGTIDLNLLTGGLASLAGRQWQPLAGTVILKNKGSELYEVDLVAPVSRHVDMIIGSVDELRFKIGSRISYNPLDDTTFIVPYIELGAELPFTAKGEKHKLPIAAQILNPDSGIRFTADLTSSIDAALDELKSLTNGAGFDDLLPDGNFELAEFLKFNEFFFDFNADLPNKIEFIGIVVQSAVPWSILHLAASNQDLVVQNVQLSFSIYDPFGVKNKWLIINGEISLGTAGTLVISTHCPEPVIHAHIKEGTTIKFTDILETFLGSPAGMPEIEVDLFSFSLSENEYSISLELEDDLPLLDEKIHIEECGFDIAHTSADGTRAAVRGKLRIADTDISLSADYPEENGGWKFQGTSGAGQEIHIGALIDDLTGKFGNVRLPSSVSEMIIENLIISFDTKNKDFNLSCEGRFPVEDKIIDIVLDIALVNDGTAYVCSFGGHLQIGTLVFALAFGADKDSGVFLATFGNSGGQSSLALKSFVENISSNTAKLIPESLKIEFKDALLAFSKTGGASKFIFGLETGAVINLSGLPLVGRQFPPEESIEVSKLQFLVASKDLAINELEIINSQLAQTMPDISALPAKALAQGFNLAAEIKFGDSDFPLGFPEVKQDNATAAGTNQPAPGVSDGVKWFTLQKSFGPVYFERIGVRYQDAVLSFLLDAALSAAGLTLSLDGLSVASPLDKFSPQFNLSGLGIDYENGDVEIGGAFLRTHVTESDGTEYDEYDGTAIIKTGQFNLAALGAYASLNGHPSLFVYAILDYPIGGPAFFFVTGLAAGFGYNRALLAPPIEEVAQFPLVAEAVANTGEPVDLAAELGKLQRYILPSIGDIFLAVGIKFTSFKMIDSFALLTFSFGHRFEMNLFGLSTMIVPTPTGGSAPTPLAEAQMALKATFIPDEGFLGVSAQLTSASYILSRDCRLTGGYAFYSWFSGEHEGDFVQTLGGYHPSFDVPAHYPKVPRLGFNWRVSDRITIKGNLYYALTASVLMAGGSLQAVWEDGDLSAWFNIGADFLISWQPYHYDARVYVNMGVSYSFSFFGRHHISVDVGADLHIWGPEFAGHAHIHLWIVSFDVSFGGSMPDTKPIDWKTFRTAFLPKDEEICSITVRDGLVKGTPDKTDLGIINPTRFSLLTNSVIPSNAAYAGKEITAAELGEVGEIGIGSMALAPENLVSIHKISITRDGENAETDFQFIPIKKNLPAALWGRNLKPELDGQTFIEDALTGFEVRPAKQPTPGETAAIDCRNLQYSDPKIISDAFNFETLKAFAAKSQTEPQRRREIKKSIINSNNRNQILQALGISDGIDLSDAVADAFLFAPVIEAAGN